MASRRWIALAGSGLLVFAGVSVSDDSARLRWEEIWFEEQASDFAEAVGRQGLVCCVFEGRQAAGDGFGLGAEPVERSRRVDDF